MSGPSWSEPHQPTTETLTSTSTRSSLCSCIHSPWLIPTYTYYGSAWHSATCTGDAFMTSLTQKTLNLTHPTCTLIYVHTLMHYVSFHLTVLSYCSPAAVPCTVHCKYTLATDESTHMQYIPDGLVVISSQSFQLMSVVPHPSQAITHTLYIVFGLRLLIV